MNAYLQLFVLDYLKHGDNIVLKEGEEIQFLSPDHPLVKTDISNKGPGKSLVYSTSCRMSEIMYWFFDRKRIAKSRDTRILGLINPRRCVNLFDVEHYSLSNSQNRLTSGHPIGFENSTIPMFDGAGMSLSELMDACGNSMSQFTIFDYDAVKERMDQFQGRGVKDIDCEDCIGPLETIRYGEPPSPISLKFEQTRYRMKYNEKSDYSDFEVVRYGFGCRPDIDWIHAELMISGSSFSNETAMFAFVRIV